MQIADQWDANQSAHAGRAAPVRDGGPYALVPVAQIRDGNGHEISACPRILNPMGTDTGIILYPRARIRIQ